MQWIYDLAKSIAKDQEKWMGSSQWTIGCQLIGDFQYKKYNALVSSAEFFPCAFF